MNDILKVLAVLGALYCTSKFQKQILDEIDKDIEINPNNFALRVTNFIVKQGGDKVKTVLVNELKLVIGDK